MSLQKKVPSFPDILLNSKEEVKFSLDRLMCLRHDVQVVQRNHYEYEHHKVSEGCYTLEDNYHGNHLT